MTINEFLILVDALVRNLINKPAWLAGGAGQNGSAVWTAEEHLSELIVVGDRALLGHSIGGRRTEQRALVFSPLTHDTATAAAASIVAHFDRAMVA